MNTSNASYLLASGAAILAALFPFYIELAVGVIDPPGGPIIVMEMFVVAVGLVGAMLARFRPDGMARALMMAAVAQALVAVISLMVVPAHPSSPPLEVLGVNAVFVSLFLGSAWLFRRVARTRSAA